MLEISKNCPDLIDGLFLSPYKLGLTMTTTVATPVQIKDLPIIKELLPDKCLVRFQFLEMIVQLARERYFLPGIKGKTTASVKKKD